jgi:hypothetical protein
MYTTSAAAFLLHVVADVFDPVQLHGTEFFCLARSDLRFVLVQKYTLKNQVSIIQF